MINNQSLSTLIGQYDHFSVANGTLPTPARQQINEEWFDVYSIPANFIDTKNFYGVQLDMSIPTLDRPDINVVLNYTDKNNVNHSYALGVVQTVSGPVGSPANITSSVWFAGPSIGSSLIQAVVEKFNSNIVNNVVTFSGNSDFVSSIIFENTTIKIYFPVITTVPLPLTGPESELNSVSLFSGYSILI